MLKITYEYFCDVCEAEIYEKEKYEIQPFTSHGDMNLPRMRHLARVGNLHVCNQCEEIARLAMVNKLAHN